MIILGFDLSTRYIGWAILDEDQRIDSGQHKLAGGTFAARMIDAIAVTAEMCGGRRIGAIAVETPFVGRNSRTAMQLGKICGVLWGNAVLCASKPPVEVSPAEAKLALTGTGNADKQAMMQSAQTQFRLETIGEHEADAIGVCLAALAKLKKRRLEERTS